MYPHIPFIFRNYDHRPTFCSRQYRSLFVEIFLVGSRIFVYFCKRGFSAVQGHPRSLILVPIESAYVTSCESVIVTLDLSCTVLDI